MSKGDAHLSDRSATAIKRQQNDSSDPKKFLKFDGWSQTNDDVTIILHAGRKLKSNDIAVEFHDDNVNVGLTDGRKWSCWFSSPVERRECRVQLKKMKVHLIAKKKKTGVTWPNLEHAADAEVQVNIHPVSQDTHSEKASSTAVSEPCHHVNCGHSSGNSTSSVEMTSPTNIIPEMPSKSDTLKEHPECAMNLVEDTMFDTAVYGGGDVGEGQEFIDAGQVLGSSNTDGCVQDPLPEPAGNFMLCEDSNVLDSSPAMSNSKSDSGVDSQSGSDIAVGMNTSEVEDSQAKCVNLTSSVSSIDLEPASDVDVTLVDSTADEVSNLDAGSTASNMDSSKQTADDAMPTGQAIKRVVLDLVKSDFYEPDLQRLVLSVYVRNVRTETLKVTFSSTNICIEFQTSDEKFLSLHHESSPDVVFSWTVELADAVVSEKCKYKAMTTKVEITLFKTNPRKWACLEKITMTGNTNSSDAVRNGTGTSHDDVELKAVHPKGAQGCEPIRDESATSSTTKITNTASGVTRPNTSSQKPTCKVSPLSSSDCAGPSTSSQLTRKVGWIGLDNLGNTCFMNSVLQVLANTVELKHYFLEGRYMNDINKVNPLGMKGVLATAFAHMMKALWDGMEDSYAPSRIKSLLAMKQSRFTGYLQHDAEEFMEFLLDGLHEDLNRVKSKPYSEDSKVDVNQPDEVIAEESWNKHLQRNDSHIVDTFQGQFRSKVTCPICKKVSVTFDPFSVVSVPIPRKKKMVEVIFLSKNPRNKPVKYRLQLDVDAKIRHMKDALCVITKAHPNALRVLEVRDSQVLNVFDKETSLNRLSPSAQFVACEVWYASQLGEAVKEIVVQQYTTWPTQTTRSSCSCCGRQSGESLKRCVKCFRSAYCDQNCQRKDWSAHKSTCKLSGDHVGLPFVVSIPVSQLTYRRLYESMELYARYSVDAFQPPPRSGSQTSSSSSCSPETQPVSATVDTLEPSIESMEIDDDMLNEPTTPLMATEKAVRHVLGTPQTVTPISQKPPFHIETIPLQREDAPAPEIIKDRGDEPLDLTRIAFLNMVWHNDERSGDYIYIKTKRLECVEDETNFFPKSAARNVVQLDDCLQLFCEPEILGADQTWYCPRCKLHCRATKEMSLWRLPQNLIIHIKRFSFANVLLRDKIEELVEFPLKSLDLSPYYRLSAHKSSSSPVIYDLYGVINHYGGMLGGHYTSCARTPHSTELNRNELGWREFDDSKVREIRDTNVVTRSAYVLFYRRRQAPMPKLYAQPVLSEVKSSCKSAERDSADNISGSQRSTDSKLASSATLLSKEFDLTAWQTDMESID